MQPHLRPLLHMKDVFAGYGQANVLFGIDLDIMPGECVSLLGRNGVGKSTTIRAIMGLTPPRSGSIVFKGEEIAGRHSYQIAQRGIGWVPEDRRIFPELTVFENLDVGIKRTRNGGAVWTIERVLDLFPKLKELLHRKGGFLSGGEQQMLTIARTLMGNPDLIMLDEPSEGLAPLVVDNLQEQIAKLKSEGATILLAEQNVDFVLALADRVFILQKGEIVFAGTAESVRNDKSLKDRFLAV
jgi:branched-chain amino acid transport system ATP-binding protein